MTTSEIAGTGEARPVGAAIEADDGSIARVLGKRPVLWVGAGLSIAAGYPTTGALIEALAAAADDPIDSTRSFYEVVDAVVASVRAGRVRDVLQRLFQPARPPTPLHRALARLAKAGTFAAIVTTNYDDLMERALAAEAAPFVLQPLEDNATVTEDGVRLLKIHGSHGDWANVVLSGQSYEQFGAKNPFLGKQLDVLLRQQPILFVGSSLQDPRILDWLAGLSPAELEGLKEWRAVLTGSSWQTALAHSHRGAAAKSLFPPAVRPLVVRDHDHARALFVDAAGKLPTPAQVVALELEVTPTRLSVRDGQRLLVISGLGGLGKTALATTMAPIIARRIAARPAGGAPDASLVIALDGRTAGRAADPIRDLWEPVARGMKDWKPDDAPWATRCDGVLADAQKDGLSGRALAAVIAWWAAQARGAVVYLDDAESVQEPVAGAAELGRWRSGDLEDLWDGLCALAVTGGPTAVLVSTRYVPQGLLMEAALPLPPLAPIDLVHLLSWWPVLGRLVPDAKSWVVEKLHGHPRSVEWLEAMLAQKLAALTAPGAASGSNIDRETLAALFPPLVSRIDEDLVLPQLFTILGPAVRAFVQRLGVLSRPAPWAAVLVLEDEPGTALRAQQAGLVSPFEGLGHEPHWGALPMVLDKAGALTSDEQQSTHRRLGRWFRERWECELATAEWAEPAAHHLLEAHEANAAWEPTQRIVIALRSAGRYREALAWVERVLSCGPSGAERGLALTFDAQLRVMAGDLSPRIETHLEEALALVPPGDRSFVLHELGMYQKHSGRLADAARTLEAAVNDAIAVRETEDHRSVAMSLQALAGVLKAQGDLAGARDRLERVLRILAKLLGTEDHRDVAASLHELADVLLDQGDLAGARDRLERVLSIWAKVLGTEDHPSVAASLHVLARVLKDQGDLAGARDRFERVLSIWAKVLGTEDHPSVAASLHELARVLHAQGDLVGTRDRLERSLRIWAKVLGTEDHPSVAASLHELARVLRAQGDLAGARDRLERVLRINERIYGTRDHWSSAVTEESLAVLLLQQGDENDRPRAVQLFVHAYRTYKSQLGDDHPRTRALAQLFAKEP